MRGFCLLHKIFTAVRLVRALRHVHAALLANIEVCSDRAHSAFERFGRLNATAAGRERRSVELFGESLKYLTGLLAEGRIASVEPFFLEPHGGDLEGFFLVRGELAELNKIRGEDDFQRMAVRAQVIVQNFGVVGAITGERLNSHMAWFAEAARQVDAKPS